MKVEFEVGGIACKAHVENYPDVTADAATRAAVFARLCYEARTVAQDYIRHKFRRGKNDKE